ncbi:hypothetical protein I8752_32675 [Nostocaceae cyanobacterium CENA369]|uniref:Uncharacterized protein n=1 Tax=Dendronalium phyllosphericum CENA369 TaxID=1725256 RepID=A0A8J7ISX4_9NOST|nr:hypothetical protein [Dendronalium phyllosphericum]MBH8577637.1 hypothetical protein [Dendronalium phyllosphericum CENA369]
MAQNTIHISMKNQLFRTIVTISTAISGTIGTIWAIFYFRYTHNFQASFELFFYFFCADLIAGIIGLIIGIIFNLKID